MNKQNAHLYLPLVLALAEGLPIEIYGNSTRRWARWDHPDFTLPPESYRIAPNPYQHLIDALNAGKVVEFQQSDGLWRPTSATAANFAEVGVWVLKGAGKDTSSSYRIKPDEPKVIFVNEYQYGFAAFESAIRARDGAVSGVLPGRTAVQYVEAL